MRIMNIYILTYFLELRLAEIVDFGPTHSTKNTR